MSECKNGELNAYNMVLLMINGGFTAEEIEAEVVDSINQIENQAEENEEKNKIGELRDKAKLATEINKIIKDKGLTVMQAFCRANITHEAATNWNVGSMHKFSIEQMQNIKKALL